MPKVESAAGAAEIAVGFLKSHYEILQTPRSAKLDQGKWVVQKLLKLVSGKVTE